MQRSFDYFISDIIRDEFKKENNNNAEYNE